MLLTIIGVASLLAIRTERHTAESAADAVEARLYAQSGIELGLLWISRETDWRTERGEGSWAVEQKLGDGTFSLKVNDLGSSKDLGSSSPGDPVLITSTGRKNAARHITQVRLTSPGGGEPLTGLEVALQTGTDMAFWSSIVRCDQIIGANGNIEASGAAIQPRVEAAGIISGGTYFGETAEGIVPRTMPTNTVFDYYLLNGTDIKYDALPKVDGTASIQDVVLSPDHNPYGAANPRGIYVVACGGNQIHVQYSRIVGTLLLLAPHRSSTIDHSVTWEPAAANQPALLIDGSMEIRFVTDDLSEAARGVNFNPVGTPYQGAEDSDTNDVYPSRIKGLVYASGDLMLYSHPTIDGVLLVGNKIDVYGDLDLTHESTFLENPPPGFGTPSGDLEILAGSWRQVVD